MLDLIVEYEFYSRLLVLTTNLCSKILAALTSDLGSLTILLLEEVSRPLEERRIPLEVARIPLEVASSLHSLADSMALLLLCNLDSGATVKIR